MYGGSSKSSVTYQTVSWILSSMPFSWQSIQFTGERFGNEDLTFGYLSNQVRQQPGQCKWNIVPKPSAIRLARMPQKNLYKKIPADRKISRDFFAKFSKHRLCTMTDVVFMTAKVPAFFSGKASLIPVERKVPTKSPDKFSSMPCSASRDSTLMLCLITPPSNFQRQSPDAPAGHQFQPVKCCIFFRY